MFTSPNIKGWQDRICTLQEDLKRAKERASRFFHYGQQQAGKIDGYFQSLLLENATHLKSSISSRPLASVAGWQYDLWENWDPTTSKEDGYIRIGELIEERSDGRYIVPAFLPFIGEGKTIILRCDESSKKLVESYMQSIIVRTALMLPHQARYTLLDPAGNGLAFPMRKQLANVRESSGDVRRDLDIVIQDIQRIIANYLNQEIRSIEKVAPNIRSNEKFQFVFAADFPNSYDRRVIEALQSIGNTGMPAGVYLFIQYNQSIEFPRDMSMDNFKNASYVDAASLSKSISISGCNFRQRFDSVPEERLQSLLFSKLSETEPPESIIKFDDVAKIDQKDWWTHSSDTIISTPIGLVGSGSELDVWFGVNKDGKPCAHGMLGGMPGSGKSNLYHDIIAGLATRYSPEELRLYLIDGKTGVEFHDYRDLPHAEVVSLNTPEELSRSVLVELIDEMKRRNEIFKSVGVNDLPSYRAQGQTAGKLPRILLLIDEYQGLFEGDKEGIASDYLLRLSQQGRSAGIHMLLGSQRFGAVGMMNQKGIFGNIHQRMAMQMVRDDIEALTEFGRTGKSLIAACDLPGKIVFNDSSGADASNLLGKVAYLNLEQRKEIINILTEKAKGLKEESLPRRVVFDGEAPPNLLDNPYLSNLVLRHKQWFNKDELEDYVRRPFQEGGLGISEWFVSECPRIAWVGQEFNVRGQAKVIFKRDASENALVIGNNSNARYGMIAGIIASICANLEPNNTQFAIYNGSIEGAEWQNILPTIRESLITACGFVVDYVNESGVEGLIDKLCGELDRRNQLNDIEKNQSPSIFVVMTELERIRELRRSPDKFSSMVDTPLGEKLRRLYVDGSFVGIHLILSFSAVTSMQHIIDPKRGLINFRHRIALQMSEEDSHTLLQSRAASRLQQHGSEQIRALYVDTDGNKETIFKPYTHTIDKSNNKQPLIDDIATIGKQLARRVAQ